MEATIEQLHEQYRGGNIDWPVVDAINAKIGATFTRRELATLLAEYAAAILLGVENQ